MTRLFPHLAAPPALTQLGRPLLLSLFIHGLLFWPRPGLQPQHETSAGNANLQARLKTAPESAESAATPSIERAEQTAPLRPEERSYASSAPTPTPPPSTPPDRTTETHAEPNPGPPSVEASTNKGIDNAGLREYHLALGRMAGQFRRYPQAAREAGWQGRVAMRLAVGDNGVPIGISLLGSSNYPELDQAALDILRLTAAHTPVPESLRGQHFTIDLAIDFNPDNAP